MTSARCLEGSEIFSVKVLRVQIRVVEYGSFMQALCAAPSFHN